ncbi:DUF1543 domain-containing protein [Pseudoalteromonas phenolica]|uniref:DUF1543 domain-containing protein n=1 Tax=Pseudoalteromonas phenolica TaxID=161398 RepID=A0A0S2JZN6_9GAMM|nr:DUF1543 domain-containing protein [Pseudoalteromonas phenolica]ALO41263.1 hypothetical protein PP2015_744 [Pseudoalteromonas phenolica]MBE0354198.1 hypothetical protein [Pseudoalteromonas phenolica O-BC30]RXE96066.1 DUF1543 domain-containing protein [Pseudoalteromonas phenolica O-BC30]TMO53970.1 DUF1543 domain-containing protein [Pseudoalteromonas phenolica]|tara:strand:+ start:203 stop:703 length:501 start_codon:yes stop_codon:yes gene_type:complete
MQLFMVYLGGRISGCHIEMHDIRFVIGENIEACFDKLKAQWVGDKSKVHMDSYVAVKYVDGYEITLSETPSLQREKLFFVNMGAYRADSLAEQHEFMLCVALTPEEAKQKAKSKLLQGMSHRHKDDLYDVDDCFAVDLFDTGYNIHLTPSDKTQQLVPDWFGYHVL